MILKRDNVEKIVLDESVAKAMLTKGWADVSPKETTKKSSKKKSEDAE